MKKKLLIATSIATLVILGLVLQTNSKSNNENDVLREKHISFLDNSPFKETQKLSKAERKAQGLPPNSYNEMMWELTMDPATGRPHPERLFELQDNLRNQFNRVPGENTNDWIERGPDNVGGRTRAIMYDPNDATNKRVFAGGVSGGLWVNDDITDANSAWSEVGIPKNLAISCITYDPNNTNIFYVGTGESYVWGAVNGNGTYKSTDGGLNWSKVFGGVTGETVPAVSNTLTINSPGNIAGDYSFVPASFGAAVGSFSGNLVLVDDGTGAPTEGCNALINSGAISGNIAVLERGSCEFGLKVLNAENAGAVAVIVINNAAGDPIAMGPGADGASVTIPSFMISQADGAGILTELGNSVTVNVNAAGGANSYIPGNQHINDIKIRDIGEGNSEIYMAASITRHQSFSPLIYMGTDSFGLYRSSNNGVSWTKVNLPATPNGGEFIPNDIEIGEDNKIWVSTTGVSQGPSEGAGNILSSTDGINFTIEHVVANGLRTQIAVSGKNASTIYILVEKSSGTNAVEIIHTDDAFATTTSLPLPDSDDSGTPATDFTRGQAFYDLMLEVDPTNDAIVYVGGIDLFRSADTGANWDQLSHWYGGFGYQEVHADQHALTFDPSDSNKGIFGNDGGVYYASSLSTAASTGTSGIDARNNNYNTLQFYKGAIGQEVGAEKLLAGAQDNGSQFINNAAPGIGSSIEVTGGDGAYVFIDKDNEYMITSYVYDNFRYVNYTTGAHIYSFGAGNSSGNFINPSGLDSDQNFLYTNGSTGGTFQVNTYEIGPASTTASSFTDALLSGSPTAFKPLASSFFFKKLLIGTRDGELFSVNVNNSGSNWIEITGPSFVGSISCVETGATEDDIYVTFHNYGVTSIFYSADGGSSWSNKEGDFPDIPVKAIMVNPLNSDEVIIGTDLGVWGSKNFSDTNPNWYQSQNGMKDVAVTSFDLRTADNTVLASSYGRGIFTGQFTADASSLSIDDFAQNNLIKIYPTVSNGEITIAPTSEVRAGALNIFDVNGREVHTSNLDFATGATQHLSLNLSSGVYIVKFTANDVQSTQKIIIK